MDFAEQFDAAYIAIQEAQKTEDLLGSVFLVGVVIATLLILMAFYSQLQERVRRTFSFLFAAVLITAASASPQLVVKPKDAIAQARAEKTAVCEDVIAEVADTGSADLASLALKNDCSRDKLLIAALSSGGLSSDLAKALIRSPDADATPNGS